MSYFISGKPFIAYYQVLAFKLHSTYDDAP